MKNLYLATIAALGSVATAGNMRPASQQFAQTSVKLGNSSADGLEICEEYENFRGVELTVDECLRVIAAHDLHDQNSSNPCGSLDDLTEECYADWQRRFTADQASCWLKYSEAYGFESVNDWGNDPFLDGEHLAFLMPDSRKYEHYYNDPDCNQVFRMGRGREQPDAITFGDVGPRDHNALLFTNRVRVTPWVSHDQLVIQMFGCTETCVEVRPDMEDMSRGLVDGQFRIEYKNATGTVAVQGENFDEYRKISYYSGGALLEHNVCIERTPHYLSVCEDGDEDSDRYSGCPDNCAYFEDFKQTDASVPIDMYGNYTVPCGRNDVVTFDGLNSLDDSESPRVNALVFADRCEADSFVQIDGQIVNIQGDLTGPLELALGPNFASAYDSDEVVLEFYNDPENPSVPIQVTRMQIEDDLDDLSSDNGRVYAYSTGGNSYVCTKGCAASDPPFELVCHDASRADAADKTPDGEWAGDDIKGVSEDDNSDPPIDEVLETGIDGETYRYGDRDNNITLSFNDTTFGGRGNDNVTAQDLASFSIDVYDSVGGNDNITAGAGDDLIISRGGGDIFYGNGDGDQTVQTLRVYPTHEGPHFFGADDDDTRQCTKMIDVQDYTNFELVLDDPTRHDFQYTDDDDHCALLVHGWELAWYWFPSEYDASMEEEYDFAQNTLSGQNEGAGEIIDIWFSRETGMADFCASDSANECTGAPYDVYEFCITYWVQCEARDPWAPVVDLEQDLIDEAWGSWFGW